MCTYLPVLGLMDTLSISLGKLALRVKGSNGRTELRHGVEVRGEVVEHCNYMGWQFCTVYPFLGQSLGLNIRKKKKIF